MCHHSVLNLSPAERVKKCRLPNTNKNQSCAKTALGKTTILLGFGYSTLMFTPKRAPRVEIVGSTLGDGKSQMNRSRFFEFRFNV